ncbi:MAG TPA: hypothetical protein DCY93_02955 [Firmicutes bacterium]|nr:hypothetical protein [Bacillota bacterium]
MARNGEEAHYIKIAQDICGKILTGEYPEGTLLKGRSVLGGYYGVSPETMRKAFSLLEKEKIVEVKRGVGVYVDSVLRAKQFSDKWRAKTKVATKYRTVNDILKQKAALEQELSAAIKDMRDAFMFQTNESVQFSEVEIPQGSWIDNKTIGDVYFWNYTEATIVAVVGANGTQTSPGPDYPLHVGDKLLFVGKDDLSFERVLSFLTYGVLDENAEGTEGE